jgi:hypothetical protein
MNTRNIILSAGAAVAALAGSLSLKASRPFGTGNLFCRIGINCNPTSTAHTGVGANPSTQCTVVGGTLVTKSDCSGGTWRTSTHVNFGHPIKKGGV